MCRKFNLLYKMYVTLKWDDNGCCRIHSVSDDGNGMPGCPGAPWIDSYQ